jgi:hypothetical protein
VTPGPTGRGRRVVEEVRVRTTTPVVASALLTILAGALACQSIETPAAAVVVDPEVPFLESEVGRALTALGEAREALPGGATQAGAHLDEAEAALLRLQRYYLPLLEARQRASNARQLAVHGELRRAEEQLGFIETTLLDLARTGGGDMSRQAAEPLDLLEDARLALTQSSPEAPDRLADLTERLELLLLKGDLVLD